MTETEEGKQSAEVKNFAESYADLIPAAQSCLQKGMDKSSIEDLAFQFTLEFNTDPTNLRSNSEFHNQRADYVNCKLEEQAQTYEAQ